MLVRIERPIGVSSNIGRLISESRELIEQQISPLLKAEPRLLLSPDEYTHTVKFLGSHRVSGSEMLPVIRHSLAASDEITLYAHIPVCRYRCTFCHYPVVVSSDSALAGSYVERLISESKIFQNTFPEAGDKRVSSLYFGGGTPTLAENHEIHRLMHHFRRSYKLSDDAEVTFEGTPETLSSSKIDTLIDAGVNRISVGVQSLDNTLLTLCHRNHTAEQAISAVKNLLSAKVPKVNADLIYGLPGQGIDQFASDVDQLAQLRPTSITTYRLRLERGDELKNTEMLRLFKITPNHFPTFETTLAMQTVGRRILESHGYIERPSGWFSLPGFDEKVYEDRWFHQKPLVAFGWWTYSYAKDYEYRNSSSRKEYDERVTSGKLPIDFGTIFCDRERQRRFLTFRLKSSFGIDFSDFEQLFARPCLARDAWNKLLDKLLPQGLAIEHGSYMMLTDVGKILIEEVISKLI
jgi:oxygen-independent coproporphyrinogen III oxidase